MTGQDMQDYRALERGPVRGTYRGYDIIAMPPPSSGGVALLELLNILEGFPLAKLGALSPEALHLMAEAMKPVYADRAQYLGDPDRMKIPVRGLTSKAYAAKLRGLISPTGRGPRRKSKRATLCLMKARRRRISRSSMPPAMRCRTLTL